MQDCYDERHDDEDKDDKDEEDDERQEVNEDVKRSRSPPPALLTALLTVHGEPSIILHNADSKDDADNDEDFDDNANSDDTDVDIS